MDVQAWFGELSCLIHTYQRTGTVTDPSGPLVPTPTDPATISSVQTATFTVVLDVGQQGVFRAEVSDKKYSMWSKANFERVQ